METERRLFIRFLVAGNVHAALDLLFSKLGRIKDVCIGGLVKAYRMDWDSANGSCNLSEY